MTDLQYQVLLKVKQYQPCSDDLFTREEHIILNTCSKEKWIKWTQTNLNIILTDKGHAALLEHQVLLKQQAQQQAQNEENERKQEAQKKKDNSKQFRRDLIVAGFGSIVGALITLLIQHFT